MGATVAVAVGSRGIHRIGEVTAAVVSELLDDATVLGRDPLHFEDGTDAFVSE